jgi:hypothetical protein
LAIPAIAEALIVNGTVPFCALPSSSPVLGRLSVGGVSSSTETIAP